ncbi:MAG: hypothetical protein HYS44_02955 [Candidatus Niyogibacteria bacterium]|nr:hypothetical protein [Candidatus Niyogibacteria bacterium]
MSRQWRNALLVIVVVIATTLFFKLLEKVIFGAEENPYGAGFAAQAAEMQEPYVLTKDARPDTSRMEKAWDGKFVIATYDAWRADGVVATQLKVKWAAETGWKLGGEFQAITYSIFGTESAVLSAWRTTPDDLICVAFADGPIYCAAGFNVEVLSIEPNVMVRVTIYNDAEDKPLASREFVITGTTAEPTAEPQK